MVYEIWQVASDGTAALIEKLAADERQVFEKFGCRQLETIEATDGLDAQDRFTAWCRRQCPDATEQAVNRRELLNELARAFADG